MSKKSKKKKSLNNVNNAASGANNDADKEEINSSEIKEEFISKYRERLLKLISENDESVNRVTNEKSTIFDSLNMNHKIYEDINTNIAEISNDIHTSDSIRVCKNKNTGSFAFFDLENNLYYDGESKYLVECYNELNNIEECLPEGIYDGEIKYTAAKTFLENKEKLNENPHILESLKRSIDITLEDFNSFERFSYFCMLPESVDMFNKSIRGALNTRVGKIIPIPKSVAISHFMIDELAVDERFIVIDLDGLTPIVTQLSIVKEQNHKIIKREGFLSSLKIKYNYKKFATKYLTQFMNKYNVQIFEKDLDDLIYNKRLLRAFREEIKVFTSNGYIKVFFDEGIYNNVIKEIGNIDIEGALNKYFEKNKLSPRNYSKIIVSSLVPNIVIGNNIINVDSLASFLGLEKIQSILKKNPNAIIWKELLPKVSLEVIDDNTGRFKTLDLVDDQTDQNINLSLENYVEIKSPGTITLSSGKKDFYLPLEREISFTDVNSKKEAHFTSKKFPLEENLQVDLIVSYNYLSDSPLALIAKPKNSELGIEEIENEWIDQHTIEIYDGIKYSNRKPKITTEDLTYFDDLQKRLEDYLNGYTYFGDKSTFENILGQKFHKDFLDSLRRKFRISREFLDPRNMLDSTYRSRYSECNFDLLVRHAVRVFNDDSSYLNDYKLADKDLYKKSLTYALVDYIVPIWYMDDTAEVRSLYKYLVSTVKTKNLIKITRCIQSKEDDIFNCFDLLTEKLWERFKKPNSYYDKISDIRTLSQNCWFNENWIELFYNSSKGHEVVEDIIKTIGYYLAYNRFSTDKCYRDVMEFFACLTRIRYFDSTVLNPNDDFTQRLLYVVKKTYVNAINTAHQENTISRLETTDNQGALYGYKNYIYMIIMALSGEGQVNLLGYHDD